MQIITAHNNPSFDFTAGQLNDWLVGKGWTYVTSSNPADPKYDNVTLSATSYSLVDAVRYQMYLELPTP